jgi:hypothetical protein
MEENISKNSDQPRTPERNQLVTLSDLAAIENGLAQGYQKSFATTAYLKPFSTVAEVPRGAENVRYFSGYTSNQKRVPL